MELKLILLLSCFLGFLAETECYDTRPTSVFTKAFDAIHRATNNLIKNVRTMFSSRGKRSHSQLYTRRISFHNPVEQGRQFVRIDQPSYLDLTPLLKDATLISSDEENPKLRSYNYISPSKRRSLWHNQHTESEKRYVKVDHPIIMDLTPVLKSRMLARRDEVYNRRGKSIRFPSENIDQMPLYYSDFYYRYKTNPQSRVKHNYRTFSNSDQQHRQPWLFDKRESSRYLANSLHQDESLQKHPYHLTNRHSNHGYTHGQNSWRHVGSGRPNYADDYTTIDHLHNEECIRDSVVRPPYIQDDYSAPLAPVVNVHQPHSTWPPTTSTTGYLPPKKTTTSPDQQPCIEVFTTHNFQIKSPRSVRHSNSDCQYIVVPAPDSCGLLLSFSWFHLKASTECQDEFFDISRKRLCGNQTGKKGIPWEKIKFAIILFSVNLWIPLKNVWEFKFKASQYFDGRFFGFRIDGEQSSCSTGFLQI